MEVVLEKDLKRDIKMEDVEFKGIMDANYEDLEDAFGEPDDGDLYTTDVQWKLKLKTKGKSCSIVLYNYKSGKNYNGDEGLPINHIPNWHVKANKNTDVDVLECLERYLKERKK
jgi:hypothetical protein